MDVLDSDLEKELLKNIDEGNKINYIEIYNSLKDTIKALLKLKE